MFAPLGRQKLAHVSLSRLLPDSSGSSCCTVPLPYVRSPTTDCPAVVLQACRDDFRGARAVLVDDHRDRNVEVWAVGRGCVAMQQCLAAAARFDDRPSAGSTIWQTATAASSEPPGLSRKSSTIAWTPSAMDSCHDFGKFGGRAIAERDDADVGDSRIVCQLEYPTTLVICADRPKRIRC